jgi:hypothetical protein
LAFWKWLGFLKRRQKCKKSGTLKPPRAAIATNEPIQSELDYRLGLAVSIDMLVWVTKPVLLFLWDLEVTWFEPKITKKPAIWRWFNRQWIHSKMMLPMNHVLIYYEFILWMRLFFRTTWT